RVRIRRGVDCDRRILDAFPAVVRGGSLGQRAGSGNGFRDGGAGRERGDVRDVAAGVVDGCVGFGAFRRLLEERSRDSRKALPFGLALAPKIEQTERARELGSAPEPLDRQAKNGRWRHSRPVVPLMTTSSRADRLSSREGVRLPIW